MIFLIYNLFTLICLHHNCRQDNHSWSISVIFLKKPIWQRIYQNYEIQALFLLIVVFSSWKEELITNHNFYSKGIYYANFLLCGESSCGEIVQNIIRTIFAKTIFHSKGSSHTFIKRLAIACERILKVNHTFE